MPCYDPRDRDDGLQARRENSELQVRLDQRTDQLCRVLKHMEYVDKVIYDTLPEDVRQWHSKHKEFDALRDKYPNVKLKEE